MLHIAAHSASTQRSIVLVILPLQWYILLHILPKQYCTLLQFLQINNTVHCNTLLHIPSTHVTHCYIFCQDTPLHIVAFCYTFYQHKVLHICYTLWLHTILHIAPHCFIFCSYTVQHTAAHCNTHCWHIVLHIAAHSTHTQCYTATTLQTRAWTTNLEQRDVGGASHKVSKVSQRLLLLPMVFTNLWQQKNTGDMLQCTLPSLSCIYK